MHTIKSQVVFIRLPVTVSNRLNARQSFYGIHELGKFVECKTRILFHFFPFYQFEKRENNCFTFLKKHQILSIVMIVDFGRNSVNISDCRAFSLFETVTGSRMKTIMHKLAEFVHYKSIIIFRIAWLYQTNIASFHQVQKKLSVAIRLISLTADVSVNFRSVKHMPILQNAQARLFRHLAHQHNFKIALHF